jgi:hypothetical protein
LSGTTVQAQLAELDSEKLSSAPGAVTSANLNNVITAGSVGSASSIPVITFDSKGRILSVSFAPNPAIGLNQTWQDLTSSRAMNTTYTNTTGRTIVITGYLVCTTAQNFQVLLNGQVMTFESSVLSGVTPFNLIVPDGNTYLVNPGGFNFNLEKWWELR